MRFLGARAIAILAVILGAATLGAQTYTRTQSTVTYSARSGAGTSVPFSENFDNGAKQVVLPFSFPFFNRTYNACWMNTNGQISFSGNNVNAASTASLATPIPTAAQYEAINAFRCDLTASDFEPTAYTVHFETNRVVFQWSRVRNVIGTPLTEGLNEFSFQVHLLSSGEIQLHWAGENAILAESFDFVSGIANFDGTQAFAGFGNVLTIQTARPAANTVVSLVPSSFTQAAGINVAPVVNSDPEQAIVGSTNDVVVGRFGLTARGAGGTVTSLAVGHFNVAAGQPITFRLYRDTAPLGSFDGGDVQVGTTQSPSGSVTSTFAAITEAITTGTTQYLVVANFGALTADTSGQITVTSASITSAATVWGGYFSFFRHVSEAGEATVMVGPTKRMDDFVAAGAANVPLASFEVRRGRRIDFALHSRYIDFGAITCTNMQFTLNLTTLVIGDITEVRLYRDGGTRGVISGSDTLLATVTTPATTTISFSGLNEAIPTGGTDYLVTYTVNAALAGNGTISATAVPASFLAVQTGADFDAPGVGGGIAEVTGRAQVVIGTTASTYLRRRNDAYLASLPVRPSDLSVPAMAFSLQANTGTANVTQIQFTAPTDATTYLSAARLYVDAGTPGRFDGADTQIGGAGTILVTSITFTVSQSVTTTASNYLLVVDISAAAAAGNRTLTLTNAGVTSSTTVVGGTISCTQLQVGAASANGVDIAGFSFVSGNITLVPGSVTPIATVQLAARGTGGFAPAVRIDIMNGVGGVGTNSGVTTIAVVEGGAGPVGVLDSTDTYMPFAVQANVDQDDSGNLFVNIATGGPITATRNVLLCAFTWGPVLNGSCTIVFRGYSGGTDVRNLVAIPAPTSNNSNVTTGSGGGGGGGGDEGGCSTGSSDSRLNFALLAGVMGLMFVALRTRRRAT